MAGSVVQRKPTKQDLGDHATLKVVEAFHQYCATPTVLGIKTKHVGTSITPCHSRNHNYISQACARHKVRMWTLKTTHARILGKETTYMKGLINLRRFLTKTRNKGILRQALKTRINDVDKMHWTTQCSTWIKTRDSKPRRIRQQQDR